MPIEHYLSLLSFQGSGTLSSAIWTVCLGQRISRLFYLLQLKQKKKKRKDVESYTYPLSFLEIISGLI